MKEGYTRVSEILDGLRDKKDIHPEVLKTKGAIGTEVHRNIAEEKGDGFPMFEEFPVLNPWGDVLRWEKRGVGYFRSFCEWDRLENPVFKMMEKRFYDDEFMITGQIDALVEYDDYEGLYLIDFKCSSEADRELWNMQAHFYWYLLKQNGIEVNPSFTWIQLKKDGKKPKSYTFLYDENVLCRCFEEAEKYFERKQEARMLD